MEAQLTGQRLLVQSATDRLCLSVSNCNGDQCISDDNWICVAFPMVARKILHVSGKLKPTEGLNNAENKTALNKQQT